jgi:hypothetical protein
MTVSIFIDTSALPRHLGKLSAHFEVLAQYTEVGIARVFISDVSKREWVSQMAVATRKKCEESLASLKGLLRSTVTLEQSLRLALSETISELDKYVENVDNASSIEVEDLLRQVGAIALPVAEEHGSKALKAYFAGDPPYRARKAREDIPDSFILLAAQDLLRTEKLDELVIVCGDGRLREAFQQYEQCIVYADLQGALQGDEIKNAQAAARYADEWNDRFDDLVKAVANDEDDLVQHLEEGALADALAGRMVESPYIPNEEQVGFFRSVGDIHETTFDWERATNVGPGWIEVEFEALADVTIQFSIFKGGIRTLPHYVSITDGDRRGPEYYDAEASLKVRARGSVSLRLDDLEIEDGRLAKNPEIELENIDDFEIQLAD